MGFFDFLKGAPKGQTATLEAPAGSPPTATPAPMAGSSTSDDEHAVFGLLGERGEELSGLLDKFNAAGLGDKVGSWVGKGPNLPINAEQIKAALGSDQVQAVASKLGISADSAAEKIAGYLPTVIDKMTPDGLVPDADAVAQKLMGLVKR